MSFDCKHYADLLTEWADDAGDAAPQFTKDCRAIAIYLESQKSAEALQADNSKLHGELLKTIQQRDELLSLAQSAVDELAQCVNMGVTRNGIEPATLLDRDRLDVVNKLHGAIAKAEAK